MNRVSFILSLIVGVTPIAAFALAPGQLLDPAAIVQKQVDAFNHGDADGFASFYTKDINLFDLGPETKPSFSGREALIARYKPIFSKYHPKTTILSRIVSGSFVIDKEKTEAAGRSNEGVAIYQIESGKVRRVWFTP